MILAQADPSHVSTIITAVITLATGGGLAAAYKFWRAWQRDGALRRQGLSDAAKARVHTAETETRRALKAEAAWYRYSQILAGALARADIPIPPEPDYIRKLETTQGDRDA